MLATAAPKTEKKTVFFAAQASETNTETICVARVHACVCHVISRIRYDSGRATFKVSRCHSLSSHASDHFSQKGHVRAMSSIFLSFFSCLCVGRRFSLTHISEWRHGLYKARVCHLRGVTNFSCGTSFAKRPFNFMVCVCARAYLYIHVYVHVHVRIFVSPFISDTNLWLLFRRISIKQQRPWADFSGHPENQL